MTAKPKIAPAAAAALTAQIPSRLVKKLDADPQLAERWTWTEGATWTIKTDKDEVVKLATTGNVVKAATDVACSCLLQPKCLHVAAVIAILEPDSEVAEVADVATAAPVAVEATAIDVNVAREALRVCGDVLATGAESSGAFVQAELLRTIHGCRSAGLHRLAAAQTRVLRSIRELRADRPEFSLGVLAADLRDALAIAWQLAHGTATPALVGTARRDYEPVGNLRLAGVFTEALVARSGHAGAITYLVDDKGRFYTRSDVAPGDAGRAAGAYDAPANIGDAVLPHRDLGRTGLFVGDATASADGRLGAGQKVRAVRASEPARWDHPALEPRWVQPLADQLARMAQHDAAPEALRPAGWDLAFVEGTLATANYLVALVLGEHALELTTSLDHRILQSRDNFAVLARATGVRIRAIGRVRLGAPRRLDLLALGPAPGETRLAIPEAWHGRANLHYDRLSIPAPAKADDAGGMSVIALASPPPDLLEPLRRRVERVVQGGLGTLPVHALAELERDAALLADRTLRGGAEALRDLAAVTHAADRAMTGARRAIDRGVFAAAWLRAALYDDAARRRLSVASW
jgi:hypothetical protein